ncbi:M20/M25/M40 family metallo-hydrolase [Gryllotalpicola protaetiae]|uniref:M20/M25/M40 family metallo-hydrolase n=1 Tax=Gryllotalpicola protaetiae TaxID=2419771 RepID=A0A387BMI5_9MICO|nr:M20/M25/M40 family metallo-hydrolase [Gryllotalpicola protaetiae]AYG03602.1 M20/M25/M40 family metallo-hydrolase [Gryllotalpicola protaetiae]
MPETPATDASPVRPGIAERLSRLIQLDTVSATVVANGTGAFESLLEELYPLVHEHLKKERIGERGFLFTWEVSGDPVVLMAHFDTVPAVAAEWGFDPFSGRIENGVVHGRGAVDDKGALVTLLDAVENLLAAGRTPARTVLVSLGGDEETTGPSARTISEELHARGIRPWLVLDEGGAVVNAPLPALDRQSAMVGVAEKGAVTARLTATAPPSHAATPSRAPSAPERLAKALTRLRRNPFPKRLNHTARSMFQAYDGVATGIGKVLVTVTPRLGPVAARVLARLGGEPAAIVQTTLAVTMLESGTAHNVIPNTASAVLNLRLAVGDSVEQVVTTLTRTIRDESITIDLLEGYPASPESRTDNAQWRSITDAVGAAYPEAVVVPYVMLAASDARHFHPFTPDATYRFAPLAMSAGERAAIHGIDEQVTVDALVRGEQFYRQLLLHVPT